jgi:hypothetical protein
MEKQPGAEEKYRDAFLILENMQGVSGRLRNLN